MPSVSCSADSGKSCPHQGVCELCADSGHRRHSLSISALAFTNSGLIGRLVVEGRSYHRGHPVRREIAHYVRHLRKSWDAIFTAWRQGIV